MARRLMTPADLLGPYLSAEWDARKLSLADAAAVASFPDTSVASGARTGPSVNGTQTNGSLQPAYSATGLNGYPCVVGNGSQWLDLSNVASLPSGTNPVTIITLAQGVRAGPGNRVLLQWGSGFYGSPSNHLWGQKGSSNSEPWWYTDYGGGTDDTYGLTDIVDSPSLAILGIARAGTPLGTLAVNDSQEYSKSWGNSPIGSTSGRLFYTTTGDCNPFIGKLGYGAVVSRLITPAEWQKLDAILLWGFGLQAKLAADNPDRNAAPTVDDGVAIIRRRPVMLLAS